MFRDYLFDYLAQSDSSKEGTEYSDLADVSGGFDPDTYQRFPQYTLGTGSALAFSIFCGMVLIFILVQWEKRKKRLAAVSGPTPGEIKGVGGLYLAVFLDSYGVTMCIPYLGILLVQFKCTAFQATIIGTVFAFTQTVGTLILGAMADYFDKKNILTVTLGFASVSLGLCGVCTNLPTGKESWNESGTNWAYLGLVFARAIAGFFASTVSLIETLIAEQSTDENRTENIAQVMGYFGLGAMAGPVIGGILYDLGFEVLCYSAATITMINAYWAYKTVDTSKPVEGSKAAEHELQQKEEKPESPIGDAFEALERYPAIYLLLFATIWATGAPTLAMSVGGLFVLQVYQWGPLQIAGCSIVAGTVGVWTQMNLAGKSSHIFGDAGSIVVGNLIRSAGSFAWMIVNPVTPWLLFIVASATGALINAQLQSELTKLSPPQSLGTLFGIMQAMRSFGEGLAPPVGGVMLDADLFLPFNAAGFACLFCCILIMPFVVMKPGKHEELDPKALETSNMTWKERVQQAQLHTVSYLHSRLILWPTQFVIERLHPEFRETYIMKRPKYTTVKAFLCLLITSFVPAVYGSIKNTLRIPVIAVLSVLPLPVTMYPSSQQTKNAAMVCCIGGPGFTLLFALLLWRKLRNRKFQHLFFGSFRELVPALLYNGLGPWGDPRSAKFILQDAYEWQHDLFGGTDLVVLSVSMAASICCTTSIVGYMDNGYFTGFVLGLTIGGGTAFIALSILNNVLGASPELILYVNTELKTFRPHWKFLGYGTDSSEIQNRDPSLRDAVNAAANLFEKMATMSEAANLFNGRVYDHYLIETAFDMKAVSLLTKEEHRSLRHISQLIRGEGVHVLQDLVLGLQKHSAELLFSQKACWRLFTAPGKCDMDVFACDEHTLTTLSFLDIETFLGVFFDTRFELLKKIGWSSEHLLHRVFVANPRQFLYELKPSTMGSPAIWQLTASLDTYLAGEKGQEPHDE